MAIGCAVALPNPQASKMTHHFLLIPIHEIASAHGELHVHRVLVQQLHMLGLVDGIEHQTDPESSISVK
jgi:hypothetical protein